MFRSPEVGLSEYESEILLERYEQSQRNGRDGRTRDAEGDKKQKDYDFDYHLLLSGKWDEIPCNPKACVCIRVCMHE